MFIARNVYTVHTMNSTFKIIKSNIYHILFVRFYLRNSNLIPKISELCNIVNSFFHDTFSVCPFTFSQYNMIFITYIIRDDCLFTGTFTTL